VELLSFEFVLNASCLMGGVAITCLMVLGLIEVKKIQSRSPRRVRVRVSEERQARHE
jgi:hypothetical protein